MFTGLSMLMWLLYIWSMRQYDKCDTGAFVGCLIYRAPAIPAVVFGILALVAAAVWVVTKIGIVLIARLR